MTTNIELLSVETMHLYTVLKPLTKYGVERTSSRIRGSISEVGKNGVNLPQMGLINPVGWLDTTAP